MNVMILLALTIAPTLYIVVSNIKSIELLLMDTAYTSQTQPSVLTDSELSDVVDGNVYYPFVLS